eukprot:TRINITY_DN3112_c0_g1_i1.p1 TRINITY_DN3112_c0_g1~~TRINITY_DN3112_c0_g1_i1.p1  ORF type:complete len:366 (-),score=95.27 TRINITY_DN3112_c0_g1_i1:36-1133(-)
MLRQQAQQVQFVRTANLPTDQEGRVYHLKVKRGQVANRILSVGDPNRAEMLASFLDKTEPPTFKTTSNRGFTVYTGLFEGVPVSIIATGMGIAMIDFVVRETRAVVDGPMNIIRFGTCGTPRSDIKVGSMVVASKGSVEITRNPDAFSLPPEQTNIKDCYRFSKPVTSDPELSKHIIQSLKEELKPYPKQAAKVIEGLNATADTFYASQGRSLNQFDDRNSKVLEELMLDYPEISSLEMETFHLFDLARCSYGTIKAAATCIVVAQRFENKFIDEQKLHLLEHRVGRGILKALATSHLPEDETMKDSECVWNDMKSTTPRDVDMKEHLARAVQMLSREVRTLSFTQYPTDETAVIDLYMKDTTKQ